MSRGSWKKCESEHWSTFYVAQNVLRITMGADHSLVLKPTLRRRAQPPAASGACRPQLAPPPDMVPRLQSHDEAHSFISHKALYVG